MLRDLDPVETVKVVNDGVARHEAAGANLVLVESAIFSESHRARASAGLVRLLSKVTAIRHVGLFALRSDARMA